MASVDDPHGQRLYSPRQRDDIPLSEYPDHHRRRSSSGGQRPVGHEGFQRARASRSHESARSQYASHSHARQTSAGPSAVGHEAFEPNSHRRPSPSARGTISIEAPQSQPTQTRRKASQRSLHPENSQRTLTYQDSQRSLPRRSTPYRDPSFSQEAGLTEAAAPPPVQQESTSSGFSWRKEDHLESAVGRQQSIAYPVYTNAPPFNEHAYNRPLTTLYTLSNLVFFSILGTLARLGLQWLTFYPGAPVTTPTLWSNFAGTLVIGFFSEDKALFHHDAPTKRTIPLYIGLTTGFCGSLTSFSSFIRDLFFALANTLQAPQYHPGPSQPSYHTTPRHNGYSFNAVLAVAITTLAVSCAALFTGAHLALALSHTTPRLPPKLVRLLLDPLIVILALGSWLGALFLTIYPPDRPAGPIPRQTETWRGEATFALLFAPAGCLLRYFASTALNPLIPSFPLGTFSVNVLGTAVLSMVIDLQRVPLTNNMVGGGITGCQVLQGIADGFCGALTTVSTLVLELVGLKRRHAWVYGAGSVFTGFGVAVVVMGSVRWGLGWSGIVCRTGRM